jgi:large conductance mechanosensitive channel
MLKGFRDFVLRGNVLDLAVAVIIGAAFTSIVASLTKDIINPLISAFVGKPDFSYLVLHVHGGAVTYGNFINAVIAFFLLAFVIYFFLVLPTNRLLSRIKGPEAPPAVATKICAECLSEIPLAARRCKFCGQPAA